MKINIIGSDSERRAGLKTLLRRVARHAHFVEVRDWRQARAIQNRGKPDMIVIDWVPSLRIIDLQLLLQEVPGVPTAIVIDRPTAAQVFTLIGAGALGIIPRTLDPILVLRAFEMVMIGGHYIPPDIIDPELGRELLPRRTFDHAARSRAIRPDLKLSQRQEQIMRCVHMGSTNKMIAKTLGISEGTVKIHLASIFQQLGATNRAAAVAIYNGVQSSHLEILRSKNHESVESVQTPESPAIPENTVSNIETTNESAEQAPAQTETQPEPSNVIPLHRSDVMYPSLTDNDGVPLPMAAQPESTF
jgi:DNA-binding NarL/FixJ family response regulator